MNIFTFTLYEKVKCILPVFSSRKGCDGRPRLHRRGRDSAAGGRERAPGGGAGGEAGRQQGLQAELRPLLPSARPRGPRRHHHRPLL